MGVARSYFDSSNTGAQMTGKLMHFCTLAIVQVLAFLGATPAMAANWQNVFKNSDNEFFVDKDSVSGARDSMNLIVMRNIIKGQGTAKSMAMTYRVNCDKNEFTLIGANVFTEPNLTGSRVENTAFNNLNVPVLAQPNTIGALYVKAACSETVAQAANAKPNNSAASSGGGNSSQASEKREQDRLAEEERRRAWLQTPEGKKHLADEAAKEQKQRAEQTAERTAQSFKSREVFDYVSRNLWTVWGGGCKNHPVAYLSATYNLDAGHRLFRNGKQIQDTRKPNIRFEFSFDVLNGFKYRQVIRHVNFLDVVVTDLTETITFLSKDKLQISSESSDLDLDLFDRNGTKRYVKKQKKVTETLCNP